MAKNMIINVLFGVLCVQLISTMATVFDNSGSFSFDLYKRSSDLSGNKNTIVSPFSVQTALSLAYMGAVGQTGEEISNVLKFGTNDRSVVERDFHQLFNKYQKKNAIKVANKIYIKNGIEILPTFKTTAVRNFHSEADNIDFGQNVDAARTINSWVEDKTENKIKDLVDPSYLNAGVAFLIVNAIHFKANWVNPFLEIFTKKADFWISETESVQVDMMSNMKFYSYADLPNLDATAVELRYHGGEFSMVILLPNKRNGLSDLESKLSSVNFADLHSSFQSNSVEVKLPKFQFEFNLDLENVLQNMGISTMFSSSADFHNLINQKVYVSKVVHKAFISVDEKGTEAAAATAIIAPLGGAPFRRVTFEANRPFMFYIQDRQNNIIFIGNVKKP